MLNALRDLVARWLWRLGELHPFVLVRDGGRRSADGAHIDVAAGGHFRARGLDVELDISRDGEETVAVVLKITNLPRAWIDLLPGSESQGSSLMAARLGPASLDSPTTRRPLRSRHRRPLTLRDLLGGETNG